MRFGCASALGRATGLFAVISVIAAVAGCGEEVQAPDLFQVIRTGQGRTLTLLVNDSGTISCDRGKPKSLPDPLLLQARDLATSLNKDVKLRFARTPRSVFTYTVKVQNGTFSFPDTAADTQKDFSQLELFVVKAAASPCGISS